MDHKILDAIDELAGENKRFILEYLEWAQGAGAVLQLDRPLVRVFHKDGPQIATLELTTALLTIAGVEDEA